jgi:hypothetical protein
MSEWLATVEFTDGTRRFARYSTVSCCVHDDLHAEVCRAGEILPSGNPSHRAAPVGEPEPKYWQAPMSHVDDLIPVRITVEPDDDSWTSLYCARRRMVVGPRSSHHGWHLQNEFDLAVGVDGRQHLRPVFAAPPPDAERVAVCGAFAPGTPLPFHRYQHYAGMPEPEREPPPLTDLFASWAAGTVCRTCLMTADVLPPAEAASEPRNSWPTPTGSRWTAPGSWPTTPRAGAVGGRGSGGGPRAGIGTDTRTLAASSVPAGVRPARQHDCDQRASYSASSVPADGRQSCQLWFGTRVGRRAWSVSDQARWDGSCGDAPPRSSPTRSRTPGSFW